MIFAMEAALVLRQSLTFGLCPVWLGWDNRDFSIGTIEPQTPSQAGAFAGDFPDAVIMEQAPALMRLMDDSRPRHRLLNPRVDDEFRRFATFLMPNITR